jgi:TonB family protein
MLDASLDRRPVSRFGRAASLVVTVLLATATASAQPWFSTFTGTISDQTGGLLPGVAVVLAHAETGAKYEVRSNATGRFEFVALPGGPYSLDVRHPGFKTLRDRVTLSGRQALDRALILQIGSLQETIRVTAGSTRPMAASSGTLAAPAAAPPCEQVGPIGGKIRPPKKIRDVRPVYPEDLSAAGFAGTVELDVVIGVDGLVREQSVVSSSHPDLAVAAATAVGAWQFTPTYLNCVAVEVPMNVTLSFGAQP